MNQEEFEKAHPCLKEEMMLEEDKASAELVGAKVEDKPKCEDHTDKYTCPNCRKEPASMEERASSYFAGDWNEGDNIQIKVYEFIAHEKELSYKEGRQEEYNELMKQGVEHSYCYGCSNN